MKYLKLAGVLRWALPVTSPQSLESGGSGGMEFRETGMEVERDDGESEAERRRARGRERETERK